MTYPGTPFSFRASNSTGILAFTVNEGVQLSCPGANNVITVTGRQEVIATCVNGTTFRVNNTNYLMNQLTCTRV